MVFLQVSSLETQFDWVVIFPAGEWVGGEVMEEALPPNAPASSCQLLFIGLVTPSRRQTQTKL